MARRFTAASFDYLKLKIGSMQGQGTASLVVLMKVISDSASFTVDVLTVNHGSRDFSLCISSTGRLTTRVNGSDSYSGSYPSAVAADGWQLVATGKPTGNAAARLHKYKYSTNTFTHFNDLSYADAGPFTSSDFIGICYGTTCDAVIAAIAVVPGRSISDDEFERLPFSLKAWLALSPGALVLLDQAAISQPLADISGGGSNQSLVNGTSVSPDSVPLFSYGSRPHAMTLAPTPTPPATSSTFFAVF